MKNGNRLIYLLALVKFILPFVLQDAGYQPHRDEFLYMADSNHMDWGYMEVPPLLSVFGWLTKIMGNTLFWVKCWPSLFGAATFLLTGRLVVLLGGRAFAIVLSFLPFIFGAYLRVHYLFQPNAPEVFFWMLMAFALVRYVHTNKNTNLYLFGLAAGLGMLSKYSVSFYIVSLLAGIALTPHRSVFRNKHLYYAALLGFLLLLPNLVWQYRHHFPVVYHMRTLQRYQLQYISPYTFLFGQLMLFFSCMFIWLAGLWSTAFTAQGKPYRFIAWAYAGVLILLLAGHGKDYYAMGAYPVLFAFGGWQLEKLTRLRFTWLRYALVIVPLAMSWWITPLLLPVAGPAKLSAFYKKTNAASTGFLRWEDQQNHALPQDFSDMLGWEEMAQKSAKAWQLLSADEQKHTLFFCDNYGQAGAVNYYRHKYGLPEAFSDNASFIYWMPDSMHVTNLLLVTDDQQELSHPFIKDFNSVASVDSITNPFAREQGSLIILLKGANDNFNRMFAAKIKESKAR